MNVLDFIVDGLEAELALERELGVRLVECDRALLKPLETVAAAPAPVPVAASPAQRPVTRPAQEQALYDFVFLHDRQLTAGGIEMMAKIAAALGRTLSTAPVVFEGDLPRAKAYIVLGANALKKWFPGLNAAPGQWVATAEAPNILVTYSPNYILRFAQVTDSVKEIKRNMWTAIKSVIQRIAQ